MDIFQIAALIGCIAGITSLIESLPHIIKHTSKIFDKIMWRREIPDYRDIFKLIKPNSIIKVKESDYKVKAIARLKSEESKEKWFEFWLKREDEDKFLEFAFDEITLWEYFELKPSISPQTIEKNLNNVEIENETVKIDEMSYATVEIIEVAKDARKDLGRIFYPDGYRFLYADGATKKGKRISLESYGKVFTEAYQGTVMKKEDIKIKS